MSAGAYPPACPYCGGDARECEHLRATRRGLAFKACGHAVGFACECARKRETAGPTRLRPVTDTNRLDAALRKVQALREARADQIAARDRAAWEYILHTASQISFFKRQI